MRLLFVLITFCLNPNLFSMLYYPPATKCFKTHSYLIPMKHDLMCAPGLSSLNKMLQMMIKKFEPLVVTKSLLKTLFSGFKLDNKDINNVFSIETRTSVTATKFGFRQNLKFSNKFEEKILVV